MLFKALFILLCFVVMFGCLDARPNKLVKGVRSLLRSSSKKNTPSLPSNKQAVSSNGQTSQADSANQSTEGPEKCSICLSHLSEGGKLKKLENCGHEFHEDCINRWLQTTDHNSCPVCRTKVKPDELARGRTAPTNENEQQTTQHQHTITGETQTFPQQPGHIAPSSENGGWEPHEHLLNGSQHYWDQAQNQRPSNVWEDQYLQEYGQQNQGMFNDNYNVADAAIDTVGLIGRGIGRVLTVAGNAVNNYLNGTQDSEQMNTSQSVYDNPLYYDHHMDTSQTAYGNPMYHAGPSLTTGPYGQPAPGQGMHMRDPYGRMVTHAPHCPQHHAPHCPHHHPMK